jgi:hypothetical protein
VLGTAVGLALGPASDHLSCCPLTNFIQEEAQQHTTWLLKEPNSASHQYLHFFFISTKDKQTKLIYQDKL